MSDRKWVGRSASHGFDARANSPVRGRGERKFHHPIALAILHKARELGLELPRPMTRSYKVGYGITVGVEGHTIKVGSKRFMDMEGVRSPPKSRWRSNSPIWKATRWSWCRLTVG